MPQGCRCFLVVSFLLCTVSVGGSNAHSGYGRRSRGRAGSATPTLRNAAPAVWAQEHWLDFRNTFMCPQKCMNRGRNADGVKRLPWTRIRGGAGTRVDERGFGDDVDEGTPSEGTETGAFGEGERTEDIEEGRVNREKNRSQCGCSDNDGKASVPGEQTSPDSVDAEANALDSQKQDTNSSHEPDTADKKGETADRTNGKNTREKGLETELGSNSVVEIMELGKVIPAMIKSAVMLYLGTWISGRLRPSVGWEVRVARIIYTFYLIFSHASYMYMRYLIWKSEDDSVVEVPPSPQLKKMMENIAAGRAGDQAGAGVDPSPAAATLTPLMEKLITSTTPVKAYDMRMVQNMRRGQFWASLLMCYTHFHRGMIKPMMLQVAFGLLAIVDGPLFKIYVLGREANGDLARPFKKQGLMATLTGPLENLTAKMETLRTDASQNDTTASHVEEDSKGGL